MNRPPALSSCWVFLSLALVSSSFNTSGGVNANSDVVVSEVSANPYISGCLHQKVKGWTKPRVCTSQDPAGSSQADYCVPPPFADYLEIRIATGNWDSAAAMGWLTQIILSELLGVPSTIEAGAYGESRDFYDWDGRIDYKKNVRSDNLLVVKNLTGGDCQQLPNVDAETYVPCSHFIPEFWGGSSRTVMEQVYKKLVEPPQGLGVLGQESWFVTKFTAEEDPTVVSYHGLRGEKNRHRLAATFKRPTTWRDYCEEVSDDNCTTPDETAQRFPSEEEELDRMFEEDVYTGHFRYTEKNNCTLHPTNCTGHIANYPCGWTSGMESSLYHLNIGLDMHNGPGGSPSGYTTRQLKDMWHAANATRSNLIFMWWTPEPHAQRYLGTDAELQPVLLKPYTQECLQAQVSYLDDKCENNLTQRVGLPEAACGNPAEALTKLITGSLFDLLYDEDIPEAALSPAYDVLRRFRISPTQLGELFDLWESEPTPRDGVCLWATNNLEYLESMMPVSYPRVTQVQEHSIFGYVMIGLGSFVTLLVLTIAWMVHRKRDKPSIKFAQLDFLKILLSGSLLVSIGAILSSLPASDGTCTASIWFINIGYTLELMPLIIKVAAINRMMEAARTMRRVALDRNNLYKVVAVVTMAMAIYLALWTGLDAPQQTAEYELTESKTGVGDQIVGVIYYCSGESDVWQYVAVGWNVVLLLCASVLAFQSRNTIQTFNESRTLAFLIYSHFVFVVLRCSTFLLAGHLQGDTLDYLRSLIYAVDQMGTCFIYFLPKLTADDAEAPNLSMRRNPSRISGLAPLSKSSLSSAPFNSHKPSVDDTSQAFGNSDHQHLSSTMEEPSPMESSRPESIGCITEEYAADAAQPKVEVDADKTPEQAKAEE